jgi:hypothetical protein
MFADLAQALDQARGLVSSPPFTFQPLGQRLTDGFDVGFAGQSNDLPCEPIDFAVFRIERHLTNPYPSSITTGT